MIFVNYDYKIFINMKFKKQKSELNHSQSKRKNIYDLLYVPQG